MHITAGLVGLPNVGKSTLFNALTLSSVPAENYPFCTIAPHTAFTSVPDQRLAILKNIYHSSQIIPATVQFVDIAGLVRGAASGEGLGNQFLSHIRETDLIIHVVRCFEDTTITRTDAIDPLADLEIIMTELMLRDTESVIKRQAKVEHLLKASRNKPQESALFKKEQQTLEHILAALNAGDYTRMAQFHKAAELPADLLLSSKPFLIVANCSEDEISPEALKSNMHLKALQARFGADAIIPLSVRLEYELSQLAPQEAKEMAHMMGLAEPGLESLIRRTYEHLGFITFFTCGPQEVHAWPILKGITVREAAGEIHSDLQRGFICAEVTPYHDLVSAGSETKLKGEGKVRTEGQEYRVQDGDILSIKFNV